MLLNLGNPYDAQKAKEYLGKLIGKQCWCEVKELKPKRSNRQNAYLHVILGYFAAMYGCSLEEAKIDFYKRTCNRELFEVEVVNSVGKSVRALRSSSVLDSKEMTLSIERFRNWSSAVAEIYLPSPNEEQFLAYCRQKIEENREFV